MLTARDVQFYRDNGYIAVQNFFGPEVIERLRAAYDEIKGRAAGMTRSDELIDLEDSHTTEDPRIRRIKQPIYMHEAFHAVSRDPRLLDAVAALVGPEVRLSHPSGKLNVKAAEYGAPVEWHQDWAAYPHTNDDLLSVGIPLDDCMEENGPLLVLPGSHKEDAYDHHHNGVYTGGIDAVESGLDFSKAVAMTGKAGLVTFHHVRTVHGSALNRSPVSRRLFLIQYAAVDAWPILGIKDWDKFNAGIVRGKPTFTPRTVVTPIRIPLPLGAFQGSLYEQQKIMANRHFDTYQPAGKTAARKPETVG